MAEVMEQYRQIMEDLKKTPAMQVPIHSLETSGGKKDSQGHQELENWCWYSWITFTAMLDSWSNRPVPLYNSFPA